MGFPGLGPDAFVASFSVFPPAPTPPAALSVHLSLQRLEASSSSPSQAEAPQDRRVRASGAWGQLDRVGSGDGGFP